MLTVALASAAVGVAFITCCGSWHQIRKLSFAVKHSPTKVAILWSGACERLEMKPLRPLCDVRTRWGSTKRMLDRALEYKAVVNEVCQNKQLRQYEIDEPEWDALANLRDLLKVRTSHSGRVCVRRERGRKDWVALCTQASSCAVVLLSLPLSMPSIACLDLDAWLQVRNEGEVREMAGTRTGCVRRKTKEQLARANSANCSFVSSLALAAALVPVSVSLPPRSVPAVLRQDRAARNARNTEPTTTTARTRAPVGRACTTRACLGTHSPSIHILATSCILPITLSCSMFRFAVVRICCSVALAPFCARFSRSTQSLSSSNRVVSPFPRAVIIHVTSIPHAHAVILPGLVSVRPFCVR